MIRNEEHACAVADQFASAALEGDWSTALNMFGEACGADGAKLMGVGRNSTVPFACTPRVDPAALAEFVAIGGGDPACNPRAQLGLRAPILTSFHDVDVAGAAELQQGSAYADFCRRWDFLYGSQATLIRNDLMTVAIPTHRNRMHGPPEAEDRRAFEFLAPHAYCALKLQSALQRKGTDLLAGVLATIETAAFLCDGLGQVRALTPAAETALQRGPLRLKSGKLSASRHADASALEAAVRAAASGVFDPGTGAASTLIVRDAEAPERCDVVDVTPLPRRDFALSFDLRAVVTVRGRPSDDAKLGPILQTAFGLTSSEAAVVMRLAAGVARETIAAEREVSLDTVRMQIRQAYAKMGVHREAQLFALLNRVR